MLENVLTIITRVILAIVALGLAAGLFFIGIIALWYFLLIGTVIWIARKLYRAWQTRHNGPIEVGDVEIITRESTERQSKPSGRVIDHE